MVTEFREDIQGLRAIAVIVVMAFHFNTNWLPGGFVGVDIFLVISGFLITKILLKKKAAARFNLSGTLEYFYVSRVKRIAPAYLVMLVLTSFVSALLFLPEDFDAFKDSFDAATFFYSNFYFSDFGNYFAPASYERPLLHTWSLAVEMQFYLLAPLLILLLPLRALKVVFASMLVALTLLAAYRMRAQGVEQATYYSLYARLPEFFAGGLAALYGEAKTNSARPWITYVGLLLVGLASVAQPELGPFPGLGAILPVTGAVLLLIQPPAGALQRLLTNRVLVWIGAISYSLYLWHWPVLAILRYYSETEILSVPLSAVFIVSTFILSVTSYYAVEETFRRKKSRAFQLPSWIALTTCIFATSQTLAGVNTAFSLEEAPIAYRRYADQSRICHGKIISECLRGDLQSQTEVLVLGDSHAAMLNHFFDVIGNELNFRARVISASSCVTLPNFDYGRLEEWGVKPCRAQIEAAKKYYDSVSTFIIAGKWSRHLKSELFKESLIDFFKKHQDSKIIILSQVPKLSGNIFRVARFDALGLPASYSRDLSSLKANNALETIVSQHGNVEFLWLSQLSFFESAPFYKGSLIYSDEHHLNQFGAKAYAKSAVGIFSQLEFVKVEK